MPIKSLTFKNSPSQSNTPNGCNAVTYYFFSFSFFILWVLSSSDTLTSLSPISTFFFFTSLSLFLWPSRLFSIFLFSLSSSWQSHFITSDYLRLSGGVLVVGSLISLLIFRGAVVVGFVLDRWFRVYCGVVGGGLSQSHKEEMWWRCCGFVSFCW